jgi:hypothetical protein
VHLSVAGLGVRRDRGLNLAWNGGDLGLKLFVGGLGVGLGRVRLGFGRFGALLGRLLSRGLVIQALFQRADGRGQGVDLFGHIRLACSGGGRMMAVLRGLGLGRDSHAGGQEHAKSRAAEQRRFRYHDLNPCSPAPDRIRSGLRRLIRRM